MKHCSGLHTVFKLGQEAEQEISWLVQYEAEVSLEWMFSRSVSLTLQDLVWMIRYLFVLCVRSGQQVTEAVTVQIGHADTILPLLTLLGFFKDGDALTSTNYASQSQRAFRTSHMLPYAANLLFVLYDCGGGDLRLQPLLNEKPVNFPGLTDQRAAVPLYQDVRERYKELLQGCDFETECQLFDHPAQV